MPTAPYFVVSPHALVSVAGLWYGPDDTVATPAEDWRRATVDVVIPAFNDEYNIPLCLASVARQTLRPRRIILIDDGSSDRTLEVARRFCETGGLDLIAIRREAPIGRAPTIKRQAREFDSDVEFVLDGDTVLESDNYIERTVEQLYQAIGIASACGTILPLRQNDRAKMLETSALLRQFLAACPTATIAPPGGWIRNLARAAANVYHEVLYLILQRFVNRGQMAFFGSIASPVGHAVAYRRKYVETVFDHYEPVLADDLTNSEDMFIGFALVNQGYRNIQLDDVYARSTEPEAHRLRDLYKRSSSFLQSCYYFDSLLRSPLKWLKRRRARESEKRFEDKRRIREPYRQPFGAEYTRRYGRPIGCALAVAAIEKIGFPVALLIMILLRAWGPLAVIVAIEVTLSLVVLLLVTSGQRLEYLAKGLGVIPLRFASMGLDLVTLGRFAADLWIIRDRRWRR